MKLNFFGRTFHFLSSEAQLEKAINMLEKYLLKPEMLVLLIGLLLYLGIFIWSKIKGNRKILKFLIKLSPWVYTFVILGITVFNRAPGEREIRLQHDAWFASNGRFHESNVLGFLFNVALYIPYGYLLTKQFKKYVPMLIIVITSFLIEVLQYVFMRGISATDDFIANIIGGILGILVFILVKKLIPRKR